MSASCDLLEKILREAGLSPTLQQIELLWRFSTLLMEKSQDQNLVRFKNFEEWVVKHLLDSIWITQLTQLPLNLLDLGSGAGLPGIPLKIMHAEMKLILAEPRTKRVQFLREVCKALPLENVDIFPHKVTAKSFRQPIQGVITRAVEEIPHTLKRVKSFMPIGGRAIFMKGPAVEKELQALQKMKALSEHFLKVEDHDYPLPTVGHRRRLIVFEKRV